MMTRNIHVGKSGKMYDVHSWDVVCRRSIPTTCYECGEMMYQEEKDELHAYDVITFSCKNGHERTVYIEKEEK